MNVPYITAESPEQEQCFYCGSWYPKPVSYHHSSSECREHGDREMNDTPMTDAARSYCRALEDLYGCQPIENLCRTLERELASTTYAAQTLAESLKTTQLQVQELGGQLAAAQESLAAATQMVSVPRIKAGSQDGWLVEFAWLKKVKTALRSMPDWEDCSIDLEEIEAVALAMLAAKGDRNG